MSGKSVGSCECSESLHLVKNTSKHPHSFILVRVMNLKVLDEHNLLSLLFSLVLHHGSFFAESVSRWMLGQRFIRGPHNQFEPVSCSTVLLLVSSPYIGSLPLISALQSQKRVTKYLARTEFRLKSDFFCNNFII